jgi:hypothetical protein
MKLNMINDGEGNSFVLAITVAIFVWLSSREHLSLNDYVLRVLHNFAFRRCTTLIRWTHQTCSGQYYRYLFPWLSVINPNFDNIKIFVKIDFIWRRKTATMVRTCKENARKPTATENFRMGTTKKGKTQREMNRWSKKEHDKPWTYRRGY